MIVEPLAIADVLLIKPKVFTDQRGYFFESYNQQAFVNATGVDAECVQDNFSHSSQNVLRGLHYQIQHPQGKLVSVSSGAVYDVAVDIRQSSPTFGHWVGVTLSAENCHQLWVPPGFAHGFLVLSKAVNFSYKVTDYYYPQHDRCILWNDTDIGIDWPLIAEPMLSAKDSQGASLALAEVFA